MCRLSASDSVPGAGDEMSLVKNRADFLHVRSQRTGEVALGNESKTPRQPVECFPVLRNRVGLLFRFDLQPVFDAPEEAVACFQGASFTARDQFQLRQDRERLQSARFLQERVPRSVQKLERLHDKFDLANPAGAQFDVPLDVFVPDDVALDPSFDRGDFVEQIRRRALGINERLMLAEKFVGEFATAANPARFDQREPFPGFAETRVIVFHARERAREGPGGAFGPQAEIDPEKRPRRTREAKVSTILAPSRLNHSWLVRVGETWPSSS